MKRTVGIISLVLLTSLLITTSFADTLSLDFHVTLQTDQSIYHPGNQVNLTGVVFFNGSLISELVAIQVNDINSTMIFRTVFSTPSSAPPVIDGDINGDGRVNILDAVIVALHFGAHAGEPNYDLYADVNKDGVVNILDMVVVAIHFGQGGNPIVWRVQIVDTYVGDLYGNPVANLVRGTDYYVHVRYKNTQGISIYALIAFTIFDANNVPIYGSYVMAGMVSPGGPFSSSIRWRVPVNATLGVAKIYASAYSDYPQNNGYPQCPEKSSSFNIVPSGGSSMSVPDYQTMDTPGYYYLTFSIPTVDTKFGTYTIYVTSFHYERIALIASNSTTFQVQP